MDGYITNPNDSYTWRHGFKQVYQEHTEIKFGRIVNVSRKNHIGMNYQVKLFDAGGLVLENCKLASQESSFNGVGIAQPLNEGTPVVIACKNGMLQDAIIIGCFSTEGIYKDFYQKGDLQKPGQTQNGAEFNQPLGHPNRITQEDSYFHTIGGKTLKDAYDSPEYHADPAEKLAARPIPSSIQMKNQGGDTVQYTMGANILYSDGNIITVSAGDREEKSTKLLRFAAMHAKRADLIGGPAAASSQDASANKTASGIKPMVVKNSTSSEAADAIPDNYRMEQERKLADLYTQASKAQNQLTSARLNEADTLQKQFGNELGNKPADRNQTKPDYKPKQERNTVNANNFGDRKTTDVNGKPVSNKLLVVLHETVSSADSAIAAFNNPATEASYHALIKRDGTVVYLVPPEKRAFGAGNSAFNGEAVKLTSNPASVNNFAYHISLETPSDGRGNGSTHSGYTEAQYQSLAYLTSRTGVESGRITSHAVVDQGGERSDPRSFNDTKFKRYLGNYPMTRELNFGPGVK